MFIKINGKDEWIEKPANLAELIVNKRFSPGKIVVEHNFRIVPKEEWSKITVGESDNIEIVSFVGGG